MTPLKVDGERLSEFESWLFNRYEILMMRWALDAQKVEAVEDDDLPYLLAAYELVLRDLGVDIGEGV